MSPIGNLMDEFDFDFTQTPLSPLLLSTHIPTGITANCSADGKPDCTSSTVSLSWNPVAAGEVPGPFTCHVQRDGADVPQCVTTASSCTDTPGRGVHLYRIYSVDAQGTASPLSAAAQAVERLGDAQQFPNRVGAEVTRRRVLGFRRGSMPA